MLNPDDYIITRKRKKYKFALFTNSPLCFEYDEWSKTNTDIVEIGAGTGMFGVALARNEASKTVVALDVKADRLVKGAHQAVSEHLENIQFLRARADQLSDLFTPQSVEKLWITFPDPFPRDRSQNRRLTNPKFLALKPGGALYFKTDARDLFKWSLDQLVQNGWHIQELSFDLHESDLATEYKIETTYEARFRAEGLKINFLKASPSV
jgi:tRNA (guanine-N7-)-methyltransferase